jgi:hypothetical protein
MNWSVKENDNGIIKVTTGASWKAECTRDGVFRAEGRYALTSPALQSLTSVFKNGLLFKDLDRKVHSALTTHVPVFNFTDSCVKGDYYTFYGYSTTANTILSTTPEIFTRLVMTLE